MKKFNPGDKIICQDNSDKFYKFNKPIVGKEYIVCSVNDGTIKVKGAEVYNYLSKDFILATPLVKKLEEYKNSDKDNAEEE